MPEQATEHATDIATLPDPETSTSALVLDTASFDKIMAVAEVMSGGKSTVPKHLQGNAADCMAVIMQAMQWRMNPFVVAQKTHLVNGTLGYEAQLVNAVISTSGAIDGRFHYEYGGDWAGAAGKGDKRTEHGLFVRVGAKLRGDEEITWGEAIYLADITTRNSPLWKTNPKQQMGYLGVKYWSRLYCPEAILGVYSVDELHDNPVRERDITPRRTATDYGEAAKPKANDVDRETLVRDMEMIVRGPGAATERVIELNQKWKDIGKDGRAAVGRDEYSRLYSIANAEDAQPVTKREQPATTEAETVVDQETGEVTQGADDDKPFDGI